MEEDHKGPGQPTKYEDKFPKQAYKLCLLGATDKDLATFFEVHEDTINEWKRVHAEFSVSIKRGKLLADSKVAQSLFKRANGYKYEEVTYEKIDIKKTSPMEEEDLDPEEEIKVDAYKRKVVTKELAGDTTAMIFWLKNRQPQSWRDKQEIDHTSGGNEFKRFTLNVKPDTATDTGAA